MAKKVLKKLFLVLEGKKDFLFSGETFPVPAERSSEEDLALVWKEKLAAVNENLQAQKGMSTLPPALVTVRDVMQHASNITWRDGSGNMHAGRVEVEHIEIEVPDEEEAPKIEKVPEPATPNPASTDADGEEGEGQ